MTITYIQPFWRVSEYPCNAHQMLKYVYWTFNLVWCILFILDPHWLSYGLGVTWQITKTTLINMGYQFYNHNKSDIWCSWIASVQSILSSMMKLKAWLTCVAFISSHAMWVPTQLTRNENWRYSTPIQKTPVVVSCTSSHGCTRLWWQRIYIPHKTSCCILLSFYFH
jgi:hypothetical protein